MNLGTRTRDIELTSYAEVVLVPPAADAAHPAFSNLFVQTECVPELDVVLATRRPRSADEPRLWLAHVMAVEGETVGDLQWETDRARFLGRGRGRPDARRADRGPASLQHRGLRAGSDREPATARANPARRHRAGVVLDHRGAVARGGSRPRREVPRRGDVRSRRHAGVDAGPGAAAPSRHRARRGPSLPEPCPSRALPGPDAPAAGGRAHARHRAVPPSLWPHGISGDIPIVLVQIDEPDDVGIVRQLLRAHEYWRLKQLAVDLVILNERAPSYVQDLQALLETLVRTSQSAAAHEGHAPHGSVYILRSDRITPVAARRSARRGPRGAVEPARDAGRADHARAATRESAGRSPAAAARDPAAAGSTAAPAGARALQRPGGLCRGRTRVRDAPRARGEHTPAPWINVDRESGIRLSGLRVGLRVHVVGQ